MSSCIMSFLRETFLAQVQDVLRRVNEFLGKSEMFTVHEKKKKRKRPNTAPKRELQNVLRMFDILSGANTACGGNGISLTNEK